MMRRSSLKAKSGLKRKTVVAKTRKLPRRTKRFVCPEHLEYVRLQPCCVINDTCIYMIRQHPHHSKTRGSGGGDETVVPLCSYHHRLVHDLGRHTFERRYNVDLRTIAETLWKSSPAHIKDQPS